MANHTGPDDHKDFVLSAFKLVACRITRATSRESDLHLAPATAFLKTDNLCNHDNIDRQQDVTSFHISRWKTTSFARFARAFSDFFDFFSILRAVVLIRLPLDNKR